MIVGTISSLLYFSFSGDTISSFSAISSTTGVSISSFAGCFITGGESKLIPSHDKKPASSQKTVSAIFGFATFGS
ncbi:hypothetical protein KA405_04605 [Patescibacteria group bacterium]|nr:hypothetical protein [Patescibacteria group bacterium]